MNWCDQRHMPAIQFPDVHANRSPHLSILRNMVHVLRCVTARCQKTCYANRPLHTIDTRPSRPLRQSRSYKNFIDSSSFMSEKTNQKSINDGILPPSFAFKIYIPKPPHDPSKGSELPLSSLQISSPSHSPMRYNDYTQEEWSYETSLTVLQLLRFGNLRKFRDERTCHPREDPERRGVRCGVLVDGRAGGFS